MLKTPATYNWQDWDCATTICGLWEDNPVSEKSDTNLCKESVTCKRCIKILLSKL